MKRAMTEVIYIIIYVFIKNFRRLTWSHYRALLQVPDATARNWYEQEAYEQTWSVRTLQ